MNPARSRLLISTTIALLGLAAAYGTQHYLTLFLTFWPACLAAAGIEAAYVTLAMIPASFEDDPEGLILGTARWLVAGSVIMNFGHAYNQIAPGALTGAGRFEALPVVQALIVAVFVPAIAYRLSAVLARIPIKDKAPVLPETAPAPAPVPAPTPAPRRTRPEPIEA